jgi:predicted dehydrogenase
MGPRWAIMGTGGIAAAFVPAIVAEGGSVVAVGSGDADRAASFARTHGIPRHHDNHHDVLEGDDVDVVYVATTNERHHLDAMACVDAGVPVLVEKPFALDLARVERVLDAADEHSVFVMEAMWMRLQPGFVAVEERIAAGAIGPPALLTAHFGITREVDPSRRWFAPDLGGGALLDIGIYPLTLAIALLGEPVEARALGTLANTGVDAQLAVSMRHPQALSAWSCSFVSDHGVEATVSGPDGSLSLHHPFMNAPRVTHRVDGAVVEDLKVQGADLGYRFEVREVHRCLAEGLVQSPTVTWADTRRVQRWLDALRAQVAAT